MAGWKTTDMLDGIEGVMDLAAASGEDLALTADILTDGITAFGMSAKDSGRFADVLASASSNANTNVAMLGESFKYVAPLAGAMGYSAEDTALALGLMANAGIKSSQAGTSLKSMFTNLAKPTKQMQSVMNDLGISLTDSSGNMKSMDEVIQDLRGGFSGLDEAQQASAAATLFGKEAMSGALAVINASEADYNKLSTAINNSEGAAAEMAAIMQDNLAGALTNLKSGFEEMSIAIGSALLPFIQQLVGFVQNLVTGFNSLSEPVKQMIALGTALVTVLLLIGGPMLILIGFIPQLIAGFTAMSTVVASLSPVFAALTGPIGLAVAAIAGIVAAVVIAYNKVEWFRDGVNSIWNAIKDVTAKVFGVIKSTITKLITDAVNLGKAQLDKFKALWDQNGQAIMIIVKTAFNNVKAIIQAVMGVIQGVFKTVWPIITNTVRVAWELIKGIVDSAITLVLGVINTTMRILQGDWKGAWNAIKDTAKSIMTSIVNTFKNINLVQVGKDIINGLIRGIGSMAGAVTNAAKNIAKNVKGAITGFLGVKSPSRVLMAIGVNVGEGFEIGIKSMAGNVTKAALGLANAAIVKPAQVKLAMPSVDHAALSGSMGGTLSTAVSQEVDVRQSENSGLLASILVELKQQRNLTVEMDGSEVARLTNPYHSRMDADNYSVRKAFSGF